MPIRKTSVARNDEVYECFPCLVKTDSGKLIAIYRESDSHGAQDYTYLIMRHSLDEAETWSERFVLIETEREDGVLFKYNCPRISQLADGRLVALCDGYPVPPGESFDRTTSHVFFWYSEDDGESWSEPVKTPITGIVPDKLFETRDGTWLVAVHVGAPGEQYLHQRVFRSIDKGESWEGPITVCHEDGLNPCEGSIIQLPDGLLVCYMRENSGKGWPGPKALSRDDGRTWEGPYDTLMPGCQRPVAGYLPSGDIMVTFRHRTGGKGPGHNNFWAYKEPVASAAAPDPSEQGGIIMALDHDGHARADTGYSGWCVLEDGVLFAVNYIRDDADMAQIRGYFFREGDF